MRSYSWWQDRLGERFFGLDQAGRPLLFFVDEVEAGQLHKGVPAEDRIRDLCDAVAQEAIDWRGDAYDRIFRQVVAWKRSSRATPPPCLPLLAVCVMAATKMKGTGGRGAIAYYPRLADLLTRPGHIYPVDPEKHLRAHFDTVRQLWILLHEWLEECSGARGISTLFATKGRERIGYAQSQALICAADHDRLRSFFREHRQRDALTLLRKLRRWTGRSRLSLSLRTALADNSQDELLGELLVALAGSDATDVSRRSQAVSHLRMRVNIIDDLRDGWTLRWRAERVSGITDDVLSHPGGKLRLATPDEGGTLYELSGDMPDLARSLQKGLSARGERLHINLAPQQKPLVLQEDHLGGWTEVNKPEPGVPSLLLFDEKSERAAMALVERNGFEWTEPEESSVDGWFVAANLEFADEASGSRTQLRLVGGLHVRSKHELQHYIVGGEPEIVPSPQVNIVTLNGKPISTRGQRTPLRGRGLTEGEYVLQLGASRKIFYLHNPQAPHVAEAGPSQHTGGPLVEGTTVIDAEGRHTDLTPTVQPAWWRTRGTRLTGIGAGLEIPESAVWLVIDHPDGTIEVRLLREEEPRITRKSMTPAARKFWSSMFAIERPPAELKLWNRYRTEALMKGRSRA